MNEGAESNVNPKENIHTRGRVFRVLMEKIWDQRLLKGLENRELLDQTWIESEVVVRRTGKHEILYDDHSFGWWLFGGDSENNTIKLPIEYAQSALQLNVDHVVSERAAQEKNDVKGLEKCRENAQILGDYLLEKRYRIVHLCDIVPNLFSPETLGKLAEIYDIQFTPQSSTISKYGNIVESGTMTLIPAGSSDEYTTTLLPDATGVREITENTEHETNFLFSSTAIHYADQLIVTGHWSAFSSPKTRLATFEQLLKFLQPNVQTKNIHFGGDVNTYNAVNSENSINGLKPLTFLPEIYKDNLDEVNYRKEMTQKIDLHYNTSDSPSFRGVSNQELIRKPYSLTTRLKRLFFEGVVGIVPIDYRLDVFITQSQRKIELVSLDFTDHYGVVVAVEENSMI